MDLRIADGLASPRLRRPRRNGRSEASRARVDPSRAARRDRRYAGGAEPRHCGCLAPVRRRLARAPRAARRAGLSFRPATLAELYLDQGGVLPNPDLQPERAWSVDAGVRWRGQALTVSVGGFWSRYRELISYELFPPV